MLFIAASIHLLTRPLILRRPQGERRLEADCERFISIIALSKGTATPGLRHRSWSLDSVRERRYV